jgi:hypothetical protein
MDTIFILLIFGMLALVFIFIYVIIPKQLLDAGIKCMLRGHDDDRDDN